MNIHPLIVLLCLTSLFFTPFSQAGDTLLQFNQVTFSVTESQRVENDFVSVHFIAQAEEKTAQAVQRQINQKMHQAQTILNRYPEITVSTQNYRVMPVYNEHKKIQHWKGQQTLHLSLKNQPGLAEILTKVQPYLNYNDIRFSVSESQREQTMTSLLKRALARYQSQAKVIADAFGQSTYRITQTQIQHTTPTPPFERSLSAYASKVASTQAAPIIETGDTRLSITVSGRVLISNQKN
ncbi:SIMPL domain-containing protein [Hydrogenovibrio sp. 3SP14C1]|uniref:SIMPL domain-containing protein n=1 Tax=Hydrogenovibrio sp. 3SP14C1 TaxID=3038774 RepID=UPI00241689C5|nr:SIMPL domain-containing protein [Hydrogenovibrio sp. 3SP14C1]MDG4812078.1 SIMPL domain-containing protein [Hydrogenovibrio sp. 3SP14C1]